MISAGKITLKDVLSSDTALEKRVVRDLKDLKRLVTTLKEEGYRIVLTQGVWDLIHEGHARYLEESKKHGDILIVGVDSDELTKKRKGPSRPIVPETERLRMVSHLRSVDLLTIRNVNDDIGELIRTIEPDVLIVSKSTKDFTKKLKQDYAPICGKIVDLEPQATTSTTARIRQLTIEGAQKLADEVKDLTDDFINRIKNTK
jgi:D-beta-D-heptose 7-phosphate kinase/D-beta-D-heptose 1-phosphate adenosyltransferase